MDATLIEDVIYLLIYACLFILVFAIAAWIADNIKWW